MTMLRVAKRRRTGSAVIEFAVVLIFLAPLLIGVWEVGRLVEVEQHLNNAVREGGRQASTGQKDVAGVQQVVVTYLAANGITIQASDVTVTNKTASSRSNPMTATQMDQFEVSVKLKFDSVRWVLLNQITPAKFLTASTEFYSMRDVPLAINQNIPLQ